MSKLHLRERDCVLYRHNGTARHFSNPPVILGTPCVGKSSVRQPLPFGWRYIDLDDSRFGSLQRYVEHIERLQASAQLLDNKTLVTANFSFELAQELDYRAIPYIVVYPSYELKREYMTRALYAKYTNKDCDYLMGQWNSLIDQIEEQSFDKVRLMAYQFLDAAIV